MGQLLRGRPPSRQVDWTAWNEYRLCQAMGWTYTELEQQPTYRVEEALTFLALEAEAQAQAREGR